MIIYDLNYLVNNDLTDDDLHNLLDCDSLIYSLIVDMYKFVGIKKSTKQIIKEIKLNNEWLNKYKWSRGQLNKYEKQVEKIYNNIYQCKGNKSKSLAQWWIIQYGFSVK